MDHEQILEVYSSVYMFVWTDIINVFMFSDQLQIGLNECWPTSKAYQCLFSSNDWPVWPVNDQLYIWLPNWTPSNSDQTWRCRRSWKCWFWFTMGKTIILCSLARNGERVICHHHTIQRITAILCNLVRNGERVICHHHTIQCGITIILCSLARNGERGSNMPSSYHTM